MRVVVMGVSGSGKTTVGSLLAARLGVPFADADAFHSPENIAKMAAGHPLDDADRGPWLDAIGAWLDAHDGVVTCSALKRAYRDRLRAGRAFRLVYLHGTRDVLLARMQGRTHFFKPDMLDSQLAALEPPAPDEDPITVSIDTAPETIVDHVMAAL